MGNANEALVKEALKWVGVQESGGNNRGPEVQGSSQPQSSPSSLKIDSRKIYIGSKQTEAASQDNTNKSFERAITTPTPPAWGWDYYQERC